MHKEIGALVLCISLMGTSAWAQDDGYWPEDGEFGAEEVNVLEREEGVDEPKTTAPFNAPVEFMFGAGAISAENVRGNSTADFLTGLTFDFNVSEIGVLNSPFYLSLTTGAFWSPASNLGENRDGVNIYSFPGNLQVGYEFTDKFLLSVHGGANLIYQTETGSLNIDDAVIFRNESETSIFPSAGASATFGVTPNVGVMARADWTVADDSTPFIGTLGATFGL